MSYYQVPEEVLEDLDALRTWAQKSFAVARRKAAAKGKRRKSEIVGQAWLADILKD